MRASCTGRVKKPLSVPLRILPNFASFVGNQGYADFLKASKFSSVLEIFSRMEGSFSCFSEPAGTLTAWGAELPDYLYFIFSPCPHWPAHDSR